MIGSHCEPTPRLETIRGVKGSSRRPAYNRKTYHEVALDTPIKIHFTIQFIQSEPPIVPSSSQWRICCRRLIRNKRNKQEGWYSIIKSPP